MNAKKCTKKILFLFFHCDGFGMETIRSSCCELTYRRSLKLITDFVELLKINRILENMAVVNFKT